MHKELGDLLVKIAIALKLLNGMLPNTSPYGYAGRCHLGHYDTLLTRLSDIWKTTSWETVAHRNSNEYVEDAEADRLFASSTYCREAVSK